MLSCHSNITSCSLRKTVVMLIIISLASGCNQTTGAMGNKESTGTFAGVALGALAGSFVGKGSGRIVGALVGAAIGGFLGNQIGQLLDEQDQAALQTQARNTIATQPDNKPIEWKSDHSDAKATITANNTRTEKREARIVRDPRVSYINEMDYNGGQRYVKAKQKVYSAPSTSSDVLANLNTGERVWSVGSPTGMPWALVSKDGTAIGYVEISGLSDKQITAKKAETKAKSNNGSDLDTSNKTRTAEELESISKTKKVDIVTASVTCRDLTMSATANGSTQTGTQTACKSPDGVWEIN